MATKQKVSKNSSASHSQTTEQMQTALDFEGNTDQQKDENAPLAGSGDEALHAFDPFSVSKSNQPKPDFAQTQTLNPSTTPGRVDLLQLQTLLNNLGSFSKLIEELGSIPQLAENLAEVKSKLDTLLPLPVKDEHPREGQKNTLKGPSTLPTTTVNPLLVPGVAEALVELTKTLNTLVSPQLMIDSAKSPTKSNNSHLPDLPSASLNTGPIETPFEIVETNPVEGEGEVEVTLVDPHSGEELPELDLSKAFAAESALRQINGILRNPEIASTKDVVVLSSAWYHATREALYHNTFDKTEDSPWPTAFINKGGASGKAQLVPPAIENHPLMPAEEQNRWAQLMWKQRQELSDLDADALDMLCHFWLVQAKKPEDSAVAIVDEFLEMRGLKKKISGNGRRGGYMPEQRLEMLKALSHIQSIWLNFGQIEMFEEKEKRGKRGKTQAVTKEVQSRAFVVTDRLGQLNMDGYMDVEQFIYRPGDIFAKFLYGPGRQTAMLSAQAIQYDSYRQKWEKRLARYLSWQWRIQANRADYGRPYRVETLLKAIGEEINRQRPLFVRERLERALDRLQQDEVISSWEYDRWDERLAERTKWMEGWLEATVLIEPPPSIRENYKSLLRSGISNELHSGASSQARQSLRSPKKSFVDTLENEKEKDALITQLKEIRKNLKISQAECAAELGIAQGFLSRVENGKENLSEQIKQRLKEWLARKQVITKKQPKNHSD